MRVMLALYRLMLRLLPSAFRDRYADEALCMAEERMRDARGLARWLRAGRELADLASVIVIERWRVRSIGSPGVAIRASWAAWRRLRTRPGFGVAAVVMLAIAVGLLAATFGVLDSLIWRPVPFQRADEIASIRVVKGQRVRTGTSLALIRAIRSVPVFDAVHGAIVQGVALEGGVEPVMKGAAFVTPGTFEMLGVAPVAGRWFGEGEGLAGAEKTVMVSEEIWRAQFAADPDAIGRRITISGEPATLIGVMPRGFRYPVWNTEVWRPLDITSPASNRAIVMTIARRRAGVSADDARRVATDVWHSIEPESADTSITLQPLTANFLDRYARSAILSLATAAVLVFVALCLNVAGLTLARAMSRRDELATCVALGASRRQLITEAILEHGFIGTVGCLIGALVAAALLGVALHYLPETVLARTLNPIDLDARVLAAVGGFGLIAALLGGMGPAWFGTRAAVAPLSARTLRGATASRRERRMARGFLIAEVAFASALLFGATALARSFLDLVRADRGLDTTGVIVGWVILPSHAFRDAAARYAFADALEAQMRALPGISHATVSYGLPPGTAEVYFGDWSVAGGPSQNLEVNAYAVAPEFFSLYRIPLVAGELPTTAHAYGDVVISEALANRLWPGVPAVGREFGQVTPNEFRVVGVVREVRTPGVDPHRDRPEMYLPLRVVQDGRAQGKAFGSGNLSLSLRCERCPSIDAIRQRVRAADSRAVIQQVRPIEQDYREVFALPRSSASVAIVFALTSTIALAGGLFVALTHLVIRRRREFGIRAVIGARPPDLGALVIREATLVVGVGLAVGAFLAWLLTRVLSVVEYVSSERDIYVWCVVALVVIGTALIAAWQPARRATRIDPLMLLRD